jgi:hypothetical protein
VFGTKRLERGSQNFIVPIHLSNELVPSAIFYGSLAPIVVYYVAKKLLVEPYLKEKEEEEAKKLQEKLKGEMKEKKRLALAAVRNFNIINFAEMLLFILFERAMNNKLLYKRCYFFFNFF